MTRSSSLIPTSEPKPGDALADPARSYPAREPRAGEHLNTDGLDLLRRAPAPRLHAGRGRPFELSLQGRGVLS